MKQHRRSCGLAAALVLVVTGYVLDGAAQGGGQRPQTVPSSPLDALHFREIGPASMSGRISDLAVYEANPAIYYVGTAHGGVWKTTNNGTTFEAQMQDTGLMSIGDVAVSQSNPDLVWAGTGESNNRQSTSWGDGVYKSIDGGKTWKNMGLRSSRHINRLVIDPRDNNVVFVAATGSLWGPGGERGVFKTVDGGKAWKLVLKGDEDTGANDLVMDDSDNRVLYASMYQRRRTACCMNGGGPGSGIWKSTDGGETWVKLTKGLPEGALGRIAIDVYRRKTNILYALVEGAAPPPAGRGGAAGAEEGPGTAAAPPATSQSGAVSNTPTGLYRSDDAGATWRKVNNANPRPMYFSQVRIDPNDPEVVYLGGVGLHQTLDAGKTIATDVAASTHDDVHAIWINPANSRHVLIGNDGGLGVSYDMAKTWVFIPNLPVGLFYHVSYDMAVPFNVCGGMQDNYAWCGPSAVRGAQGIANHHWATVQGGDGFVVLQDPTDYRVAFSESQDGNMVRVDRVTFETMSVRPVAPQGEAPYRWNWDTPLILSSHDPKVVYAAANRVFRSADRGLSWTAVSADLTGDTKRDDILTMGVKNSEVAISRNDGIVAWPTIVSLAESPKRAGIIYAGTDDGHLAVTRDAGKTWSQVIGAVPGLPKEIYVSKVAPSRFDEARVYATFDGHRQNDFGTYVFVSDDYGTTWKSIVSNLAGEVARTITEDLKNPDVLYLGTETGLFVTLDRGKTWSRLKANLPTVRIDEITLHPRDNAMILATHGRSLWILDHLEPIQELAAAQAASAARLFSLPASVTYRRPARDRNYEFWGDQVFFGENPPAAAIVAWNQKAQAREVRLVVSDAKGAKVREISGPALESSTKPGYQAACWDLRVQPLPAPPGTGCRGASQTQAQGGQPAAGTPSQPAGRAPGQGAGGGQAANAPAQGVGVAQSGSAPTQGASGAASGGAQGGQSAPSPFGAGCGTTSGGGGGGFGGGATLAGPFVLPGTYTVSLIVDGKTVDTKPLRVTADPEVAITDVERKRMFDLAMEMHELQRRVTEAGNGLRPLNARLAEIKKELDGRPEAPSELKMSVDSLAKDVSALLPKFAAAAGRGGAPQPGTQPSVATRIGQAKTGLMGGIGITDTTMRAYNEAKAQGPKTIADANTLLARAATVSEKLAALNLALTVPGAVR